MNNEKTLTNTSY